MQPLNIQIFVDVMALLLGNPPEGAVFAFDDSTLGSKNNGTPTLQSTIWPGQLVRWTVTPVDVQTSVWISDLSFGDAEASEEGIKPAPETATPWAESWEGYVPAYGLSADGDYPYRLTLRFGALTPYRVAVEGLVLRFPPQPAPISTPVATIVDGVV
ncbi:hypothetical protein RMR16_018605 [Agrobacterium sp. rho-13.3]|uniref:hypothetical protein n=1 Tax=Agrobacterium sp. rho-13.3 TaxID=3072980 RepID=UPI002A0EA3F8|nr:hypothetical protein [Agrobacterium sp. rho-13.3]MDX8308326.1 hypothetical protein [Agrobacterium sp. rho-13.3]